jgi:hypothetical protein
MTHKGRVSPFGDPRIKGCSPLPAAFRSVPRPSSPLSAKASTKCPYALDPKLRRRTQRADPCPQPAKPRFTLSTSCYPPGRQPGSLRPELPPKTRQPRQTASRIPIHNVKEQRTEIGGPRTNLAPRNPARLAVFPRPRCWWSRHWWSRPGSNRRPPACKAGALPAELRPQEQMSDARDRKASDTRYLTSGIRSWWAREDLNFRPHAYQARALTS